MQHVQLEPIAIVGMGCRFPGASNPKAFWELLRDGRDAICEVPADRWKLDELYDPDPGKPGKMVSRWGGFLNQVDQFDWHTFHMLPREVKAMDPQHRLLLEVSWEAFEDAGLPLTEVAGSRTSVSIGIGWSDYLRLQSQNWSRIDGYTATGNRYGFAANRISYAFDLKGPSLSLDTGCTSSLSAIHLACQSLWMGEASLALAGGVHLMLSPDSTIMVSKAGLLSPEGRCKTLDAQANGFVLGEGAGIIVLKPSSQLRQSDRVYALIHGISVNHNGHNEWIIAASSAAQEAMLRDVYSKAGINPANVDYVELHGAGFARGDLLEVKALGSVLGASSGRTRPCLMGSVKTNIGNLEAAAGIASVIKVALSLHHREIPPTLNIQTINPEIPLQNLNVAIQQRHGPWPEKEGVAFAGVTTLSLTGANAHMVLASAPGSAISVPKKETSQIKLLTLSARSKNALYAQAAAFRDFLRTQEAIDDLSWHNICYTASRRRTHHEYRLAVIGRSSSQAATVLDAFLQEQLPPCMALSKNTRAQPHKLAFLFAQQECGWSLEENKFLMKEHVFRVVIEECDRIFRQLTMTPLLLQLNDDVFSFHFNRSVNSSIVQFTCQIALAALWHSWGIVPDAVIGDGLGEVAAACVAGRLPLASALQLLSQHVEALSQQNGHATMPLYSTTTGLCEDLDHLTSQWKKKSRKPELSIAAIDQLLTSGYDVFVELGPPTSALGAILARLHHYDQEGTVLPSLGQREGSEAVLLKALGTLYALGYTIDWATFSKENGQCVSLPTYCWQRERLWPDWLDSKTISTPPELRNTGFMRHDDIERLRDATSRNKTPDASVEMMLAEIWANVLGLEQVSIHDNFFEMGGHSLLAGQLLARIQAVFQVELSLRSLFEAPTPASCAALLDQAKRHGAEVIPPALPSVVPNLSQRFLPFPTTDVQQAYWIGRSGEFELGNVGNHGYIEVEALGLDLQRFTLAVQKLIERHEMLRAIILPDGRQQILEHVPPYQVKVIDLRGWEPQAVTSSLEHTRTTMDHQVFAVEQWPAFDISISRLDSLRFRIHVSIEVLFADAWSMHILLQEFTSLYHEPDRALPALELSFRDYVLAEAALQSTAHYQHAEEYWNNRLSLLPSAPELPLAQSPGSLAYPRCIHREARLHAETWQRLKERGAQAGLTPSGVLLAAFAEVLTLWSKTPRFSMNLTLFHRLPLHEQVNSIVGDFTSLTLLAIDNAQPDSFENRARRLQAQLWSDLDHSYYSGIRVLRSLARMQGETGKAMMPVVFTSLLVQDTAMTLAKPWQETVYCVSQTPQVWLDHQVLETDGALVFHWQSVDAIFPDGLIDAMFEAYCQFLQQLSRTEESWHESKRSLIPQQQIEQRAKVNATEAPVSEKLLQAFFLEQAHQHPSRIAVISPNRTLTYQEVYSGALQLAYQLRQYGVRPNQLVAVVMRKGWEQVVAVLGVLLSGAAYLPIDANLPIERLRYLLEHGEVRIALTQTWIDSRIEWPEDLKRMCVDTLEMSKIDIPPLEPIQGPEDLAYVIYTSGSTGLPKGVMIDHRGAVNTILDINKRFKVGNDDRVLALSSLSFDLSVYDIFGMLAVGGAIVMPTEESLRDPARWLTMLIKEQITIWNSVPALLQMFVEYIEVQAASLRDSCLRLALLSGDWIPLSLADRLKKLVSHVDVISLGGATEASIWSILYPITCIEPAWKSIPYGRPMFNQQFYVLNEALDPCPVWVPGQLFIGGIGLAKGYWRDEEKTRASFFIHPHTGQRLYRTGDLGRYFPDGTIDFLGREDFQVKVQGYRIELGEIEVVLAQFPAVGEAIVAAIGERHEDKRLVAYLVARSEQKLDTGKLRNFLQERLPAYMVPSTILVLDTLPLSANGKVDRKALSMLAKGDPDVEPSVPPTSTLQHAQVEAAFIAQITQRVASILKVESINPQVNLLEYGATSLSIIRIVNLLEKDFHFRPKLDEFFRFPNVLWLASTYEKHLLHQKVPMEEGVQGGEPLQTLAYSISGEREEGEL